MSIIDSLSCIMWGRKCKRKAKSFAMDKTTEQTGHQQMAQYFMDEAEAVFVSKQEVLDSLYAVAKIIEDEY